MAQNRKRAFEGLYSQLEETDGHAVLFSARGDPSVIFEMANPVQQLCTDSEQYLRFQDVLSNLVQTLGEGYALQKQDIFCKQSYHHDVPEDAGSSPKYAPTLSSPRRRSAASSCSTTRRCGRSSMPR